MLTTKEILGKDIYRLNIENYENVKKKVHAEDVTWVLGTGISVPAGLPDWKTLLGKMWGRLSELENDRKEEADIKEESGKDEENKAFWKARKETLEALKEPKKKQEYLQKVMRAFEGEYKDIFDGVNMLEAAEYMQNYIEMLKLKSESGSEDGLQEQVMKSLLRNSLEITLTKKELADKLQKQAIGYLARLLAKRKCGNIITYNFDDLLEFCLDYMESLDGNEVQVICDCDKEKRGEPGKIHIQHPHGALEIVGSRFSKESEHVILTERSYYKMEQTAYNWENSVQAKALVETSCVFMGFSGDDYNFRRIMKNAGFDLCKDTSKHYIFLCINDLFDKLYEEETKRRYTDYRARSGGCMGIEEQKDRIRKEIVMSEEFAYERIQLINKLSGQYHYWKKHGIIPIWTTFAELPELIHGLC